MHFCKPYCYSCTRIQYLLGIIFGYFLGSCENHCFLSQTGEATFWATFVKTWTTFYFNIWSHWLFISFVKRELFISWKRTVSKKREKVKMRSKSVSQLQFDQIGRFLKDHGYKFSLKISPNIWWLFGAILNNWIFQFQTSVDSFWATIGKHGLLLMSTSGHTGRLEQMLLPDCFLF